MPPHRQSGVRAPLLAVTLALALGCSNGDPVHTTAAEVEQFVIAVGACVPSWFLPRPALESDPLAVTMLLVSEGDFRSRTLAPFRCVVDAGSDCVRVRACYGLRSDATSGPCMGAQPRCDADDLLLCIPALEPSPTQIGRIDCTSEGLGCFEAESAGTRTARCAAARCDGSVPPHCEGATSISCDGLFEVREEAPLGMTCSEELGFVHFVGDGEPCTASECVGDIAIECDLETRRTRAVHDCSVLAQTCTEASFVHCVQPVRECGLAGLPSCASPTLLRFCAPDGHARDYDCLARGFAGCEERFFPERGLTLGGCAPRGPRF
jgi:hypothetical protein